MQTAYDWKRYYKSFYDLSAVSFPVQNNMYVHMDTDTSATTWTAYKKVVSFSHVAVLRLDEAGKNIVPMFLHCEGVDKLLLILSSLGRW